MKPRAIVPILLVVGLALAGCAGGEIPDFPATLTAISPPSPGLDLGSLVSTMAASIPKNILEIVPDPVFYGSGCSSSEPTNIYVTFTETSELLAALPLTSKGAMTSVAYRFHGPSTITPSDGEAKYIVSLLGVVGAFHIFPIDLSVRTFDGTEGWIDLWVQTEVMSLGSGPGGGLSVSTTKVFESKPLRIVARPCKGGTATPTATATPPGFDYSGDLHVLPDIVYGGSCPPGVGTVRIDLFFQPAVSPDVATPPVPVKYYALLDFTTASGTVYPSVIGEMSWVGPPGNYWSFTLPAPLAPWPPPYEKGLISVAVLVQTDAAPPVTVYHSGVAQIPFSVCEAASPTPTPTVTHTPVPTVRRTPTNPPPPPDNDQDGYRADVDCNDNDPSINPGAQEDLQTPNVDENCNGSYDF